MRSISFGDFAVLSTLPYLSCRSSRSEKARHAATTAQSDAPALSQEEVILPIQHRLVRTMGVALATILLLAGSSATILAQSLASASLTGKVVDNSGAPVPNATVTV